MYMFLTCKVSLLFTELWHLTEILLVTYDNVFFKTDKLLWIEFSYLDIAQ